MDDETYGDDRLVDDLRRIAADMDPVPDGVLRAARAAILARDLDGELAKLVGDSAAQGEFEAVRAGAAAAFDYRLLSFTGGAVHIDLEVSGYGGQAQLMGQVTGASGECVLERPDAGPLVLALDSLGRFLLDPAPRGPVRIRCRSASGTPVRTAWMTI